MEQIELQATNREILGKKVRLLRRQGITPAHLFGHDVESVALQCDAAQLRQVLAQAGKTRLISLKLDKAKQPRNVVVREIQKDPITGELVHIDFYQIRMTEKIKMDVPIVLVGKAPALSSRENMLFQELNNLTIKCLPAQIPPHIELDVSSLAEVEQSIQVKDIIMGEGITVLTNPEQMVVKISLRPVEKIEKPVVEEVVEAPEAAPLPEEEAKEEPAQ